MQISKTTLRRIIKEEAQKLAAERKRLSEAGLAGRAMDFMSKKVLQNPDEFAGSVELDELASCVKAAVAAGIPAGEVMRVVRKNLG